MHWAKVAAPQGVEVEPITKKDLARLAEFDALFIRETTSIRNHTYHFARRAMMEGMPVIDDPISMIRCTNKVYLWERLTHAGLPVPETIVIQEPADAVRAADTLGFPGRREDSRRLVQPRRAQGRDDGGAESDRRGVLQGDRPPARAALRPDAVRLARRRARRPAALRLPVRDGQEALADRPPPRRTARPIEGGFRTFPIDKVPPEVLDAGVRAASLIGDGLYGVDLKETPDGVFIIEINDNPNLEHGVEDLVAKSDLWNRLTRWFTTRILD